MTIAYGVEGLATHWAKAVSSYDEHVRSSRQPADRFDQRRYDVRSSDSRSCHHLLIQRRLGGPGAPEEDRGSLRGYQRQHQHRVLPAAMLSTSIGVDSVGWLRHFRRVEPNIHDAHGHRAEQEFRWCRRRASSGAARSIFRGLARTRRSRGSSTLPLRRSNTLSSS